MNADPADQLRLLDLQAVDTALAQLTHKRRTLPELAELTARATTAAEATNRLIDAQTLVADIELEQRRLENDVDTVRTRAAKDESRLQAGGLPARELEGLQHEIVSLARRQSSLEDDLLEVMERGEQAESDLAAARTHEESVRSEISELETRRDASFAEIDNTVGQREPQRAAIATALPGDLLALYEKSRAAGGHGAAMLRQRRCEGCRIELSGSEVSALRSAAPDAVVRCENCRAILVRTTESGL
ncbi:zinc ribbon domain-containing protein [uncultured Jatrophihabitans sp.]|uniref:zinc ribbon domain-containing protein n=1 Tax=uncultured Jatrophihabitans sp. TaxID=1610747 RepID=UPI0035CC1E52